VGEGGGEYEGIEGETRVEVEGEESGGKKTVKRRGGRGGGRIDDELQTLEMNERRRREEMQRNGTSHTHNPRMTRRLKQSIQT
jgi:hypothetical protein